MAMNSSLSGSNVSEIPNLERHCTRKHDFINYLSVPSLESIATVSVATALSVRKQSDFENLIRRNSPILFYGEFISTAYDTRVSQLQKEILNNLSLLPLPDRLKKSVSNIVSPIQFEISSCIRFLRENLQFVDSFNCNWTNEGTFDRIKTFKQIYESSGTQLNYFYLFDLACISCVEDIIQDLWDKLTERERKQKRHYSCEGYSDLLITYWISVIENKICDFINNLTQRFRSIFINSQHSVHKNMFTLAISCGDYLAVKYFWKRLTAEEVNVNLTEWVNMSVSWMKAIQCSTNNHRVYQSTCDFTNVLYFLLSKTYDAIQQRNIFQKNGAAILLSLFSIWPWQRFLLPTIQVMWDYLSEESYFLLLEKIAKEIKEGQTTEKLLRKLWCKTPMNFKTYFIQNNTNLFRGTNIFCNLLAIGDVETIELILNYANVKQRTMIVFLVSKNEKMLHVILKGKLRFFCELVQENISSESDVHFLKVAMAKKFVPRLCEWISITDWQITNEFFNWAFSSRDEIENARDELIDKHELVSSLLKNGNYEKANLFINWCFFSEQEIDQFRFAALTNEVLGFVKDWESFETFLVWCFGPEQDINELNNKLDLLNDDQLWNIVFHKLNSSCDFEFLDKLINWYFVSEQDIKEFKLHALQSPVMRHIICCKIEYEYDFKLVDELIDWSCQSNEEIKRFKATLVRSEQWANIRENLFTANVSNKNLLIKKFELVSKIDNE